MFVTGSEPSDPPPAGSAGITPQPQLLMLSVPLPLPTPRPAAGLAPAPPPLDIVVVGRRMPLADVVMTPRACLCIRTVVQPPEVMRDHDRGGGGATSSEHDDTPGLRLYTYPHSGTQPPEVRSRLGPD